MPGIILMSLQNEVETSTFNDENKVNQYLFSYKYDLTNTLSPSHYLEIIILLSEVIIH